MNGEMNDVLFFGLAAFPRNPTDGTDGGPDWIDTDHYTIEAKAEVVTDRALMQGPMLQTILEDRFKIKVHKETREIAVDALVIAKGGAKLKPFVEGSCIRRPQIARGNPGPMNARLNIKSDAGGKLSGTLSLEMPDRGMIYPLADVRVEGQNLSFILRFNENPSNAATWKGSIENNGARLNGAITQDGESVPLVLTRETAVGPAQEAEKSKFVADCRLEGGDRIPGSVNIPYHAEGVTIGEFIQLFLSKNRPRYVLDNTGLTGKFDIHFESDSAEVRQRLGITEDRLGPSTAPPFPDALQQQLGLKLESTKGPVELLVIDRIERPSSN
jgi:uncharacterized protein (TIGR03435 family)